MYSGAASTRFPVDAFFSDLHSDSEHSTVALREYMTQHDMLFATTNAGKLLEAQSVAESFGVTLVGLDQVACERSCQPPYVGEGESSYQGNAVLKARTYATWSGLPTIADDTGLEVRDLGGLPGLFTARFGVDRVRQLLGNIRLAEAAFVCCVAYAEPTGRVVSVIKRLEGRVSFDGTVNRCKGPLPYSEIFTPHGEWTALSQLVRGGGYLSHRGRALTALFCALGRITSPAICRE
jgi:XTP/dITP diphosphohydrolase